eukprot:6202622-Pleurochrysis_carterae.AAC.2
MRVCDRSTGSNVLLPTTTTDSKIRNRSMPADKARAPLYVADLASEHAPGLSLHVLVMAFGCCNGREGKRGEG